MLIITADDYGKTKAATDSIVKCFSNGRITSASAMVFMEDSERAAAIADNTRLEVGLHLNFSMPFSADSVSARLRESHAKVISYLTRNKLSQTIYNPLLADSFKYLFLSQQDEFLRLYHREPDFYNGHHHMHFCANVLLGGLIPKNARVRRTFTFDRRERGILNRSYRRILDIVVSGRFVSTDYFFSIEPVQDLGRLQDIFARAARNAVEIEVHPENIRETDFLLSDQYRDLINSVPAGKFSGLTGTN